MQELTADALPCAVVSVDADDRILAANAVFTEWTGWEGTEARRLEEYLEPGTTRGGLAAVLSPRGDRRPVLASHRVTREGAVFVFLDATERSVFEQELLSGRQLDERTRTRLQLVIDASIAFAAAGTEPQLAEILADTVARAYRAEESAVFLGADHEFVRAAGADPLAGIFDTAGFIRRVIDGGRVVKISGIAEAPDPQLATAMQAAGVQAIIAAPLIHDGVAVGMMACYFHHARRFDTEAGPLADALAGQAAQVAATLRLQKQLQHAATHDEITGLPNRRFLEEQSGRFAQPAGARVAVIFIDLDGFKRVNDELGHPVGDRLLGEIGRRLQAALREDDIVARYGGDEFLVVCEVPDPSGARDLAERLRRNLAAPFDVLPEDFSVGASFGIAIDPGDGSPVGIDQLIRAADQAMYRSKTTGGNRISVGDDAETPLTGSVPLAPEMAGALQSAVLNREFEAWFQPQIDLRTGAVVGAEALARWRHPEFGMIGPATFIPAAEDAGLIGELGVFMAEQCYLALEAWSTERRPIDISVNVSPIQLKTSAFSEWLASELALRTFAGGRLTIEITESRPVADMDAVVERLQTLRDLGVGVAIDDFGAGHASLGTLQRLHGSEIKLDRSLVADLSSTATAEMATAIAVAHRSGILVVAEGVETREHLDRVIRLGCDRAQGYLLGKPMPPAEFAELLATG